VLPDAHYGPPTPPQLRCNCLVSVPVSLDLFRPITRVGIWSLSALGATVPEASVHKDCQIVLGKREIRFAKHAGIANDPTLEPSADQGRTDFPLCGSIVG